MNIPAELKYTESHEWVRTEADGTVSVGITEYAQDALGDIVFVELPKIGQALAAGKDCAVVESVKAASDIYAPAGGTVTGANSVLEKEPSKVNEDPEGAGWFFKMTLSDKGEFTKLMDAAAYAKFVEGL